MAAAELQDKMHSTNDVNRVYKIKCIEDVLISATHLVA